MENVNNLSSKHGYYSNDIKYEKCSATIPMKYSIGDERMSKSMLIGSERCPTAGKIHYHRPRHQCLQCCRRTPSGNYDLSMRCQSEFDNIHRLTKSDTEKLKERITATTDAITECYKGNHRLCKLQSTVCMGESDNNWLVKSEHLPCLLSNLR